MFDDMYIYFTVQVHPRIAFGFQCFQINIKNVDWFQFKKTDYYASFNNVKHIIFLI